MIYTILGQEIDLTEADFHQLVTSFAEMKNWPIDQAKIYVLKKREYVFMQDRTIIETWLNSYEFGAFAKGMPNFDVNKATLEALQSSSLRGIEDE